MTNQERMKRVRASTGLSQAAFSKWLGIPKRTIENWETGSRELSDYIVRLIEYFVHHELVC